MATGRRPRFLALRAVHRLLGHLPGVAASPQGSSRETQAETSTPLRPIWEAILLLSVP